MFQELHNRMLPNYKVSVRKKAIEDDLSRVIVQYHRFPGTYSVVCHASLDGVELVVTSSPCVDPRNFSEAIGEHYGKQKVLRLAEDKLWEMHGIVLAHLIETNTLSEEEFYNKYNEEYLFTRIETSPTYRPA